MKKFAGMRRARMAAVLAVVAAVIATGSIVASSRTAPAPAALTLTRHPAPASARLSSATFAFASARKAARFRCSLDSASFSSCVSPVTVRGLAAGGHTFTVQAVSGFGASRPARYTWQVPGAAAPYFRVGGDLSSPLYPGTSESLDLTFTNPGSVPITIRRGAVSAGNIVITTFARGCPSSNFAVTQGLTADVTVPAHQVTPTSLSARGVPETSWPVIKMLATNKNQNACQDAKLTLTYTGIKATG